MDPRWREWMQAAADARKPDAGSVRRVRAALDASLRPDPRIHEVPAPSEAAVARVRARLGAPAPTSIARPLAVASLLLATLAAGGRALWAPTEPQWAITTADEPSAERRLTRDGQPAATLRGEGTYTIGDDGWLEIDWIVGDVRIADDVPARGRTRDGVAEAAAGGGDGRRDRRVRLGAPRGSPVCR